MIVYEIKFGGLFDKDEQAGTYSAVLRCFHNDNTVTFDRFDYADNGTYIKASPSKLKEFQCTYYLEDGSRPLKTKDCKKCKIINDCSHNQKYYDK